VGHACADVGVLQWHGGAAERPAGEAAHVEPGHELRPQAMVEWSDISTGEVLCDTLRKCEKEREFVDGAYKFCTALQCSHTALQCDAKLLPGRKRS
jgi:hypothetical protein